MEWDLLSQLWIPRARFINELQKLLEEYGTLFADDEESYVSREWIYEHGGKGYWSKGDENRVILPLEKQTEEELAEQGRQ